MKALKQLFSSEKRREEMKNFKAQCEVLETKVSAFLQNKSKDIPSGKLAIRNLQHPILNKDDAVAFFGEFLGEEVNKHLVALVKLEEQYSPQKNKMLCWTYKNFFIRLTDKKEYGYFADRMFSKLVITDEVFSIPVAPFTNLKIKVRNEEIFPIDIVSDERGKQERIKKTLQVYATKKPLSKVLEDIKCLS